MSARRAALLLVAAVLATSCGSGDPTPGSAAPEPVENPSFPVTIDAANGDVTIEEQPDAIVSISPTATEMLFAIGAGDQVVAVDDQSNYPPEAPVTDLSGFEPNIEAIATYEPDLVVFSFDPGRLEKGLRALGIPALMQSAAVTLDDTYDQIEQLGAATGRSAEADDVVAGMETEIEAIVDGVPDLADEPTYYYELDDTYFTATSETYVGTLLERLGLTNIADPADKEGSGYPQLSPEYIVKADPDLIFLADTKCCGQSDETIAKRPGWNGISAVEEGHVIELDDDLASRWGPRIVELLRTAADAVAELAA
ncbi:MAG: ABC transporter substrate-binding protein [Actinomycetota bacterium]|nr:ABC transporter substrate-binding protein [Actinomycetota bacterium]